MPSKVIRWLRPVRSSGETLVSKENSLYAAILDPTFFMSSFQHQPVNVPGIYVWSYVPTFEAW